ncbi:MAG: anthranilate synthase component I family protein [Leucobacter sp.]
MRLFDERVRVPLPFPVVAEQAAAVLAASGRDWFWLDGTAATSGEPRQSRLGVGAQSITIAPGRERDFFRDLSNLGRDNAAGVGWVVAAGYEFGVALMGLRPIEDPQEKTRGFALRIDVVLTIDHETGQATLEGNSCAVTEWLEAHEEFLRKTERQDQDTASRESTRSQVAPALAWRRSDERYRADVEACRAAIREGEAYVLCLTDTAEARGSFEPFELYRRLRRSGGASRGGVIVTSGRALVSGSPERFLSLRGDHVATHPIKGTRPRGTTPDHDRALAVELAADPKERAENLMIVDLMRNDLSRVCVAGTVSVDRFLEVETHPHVHQLVSSVSGRMTAGAGLEQVLEACFPGGSMTGAPKRRAVELLAELEGRPRGLYSGCFGWIDASGDAELAMTIRGIELRGEGRTNYAHALIGAGGGITVDSDPDREVAEKHLKADSLIAALYP